ncbi:MAG: hypothetical protein M4D80_21090 [Myxococcota bacterium]|nr:hypothetical protein [Myxococcota bacterium]
MTDRKSAEVRRILDRYLVEIVEAYDLCPWAKSARLAGEVSVEIVWGTPALEAWEAAARAALAKPEARVAMIVAPELAIERDEFSAVRDAIAARIPTAGVADFHPRAPLDLASPSRLVPFVRRSPDPLLQLVPLAILDQVRSAPPLASTMQQAQILGGHAAPPREDVASRIARANHATVTANAARITEILDDIAKDRLAAYMQ